MEERSGVTLSPRSGSQGNARGKNKSEPDFKKIYFIWKSHINENSTQKNTADKVQRHRGAEKQEKGTVFLHRQRLKLT